VSPRLRKAVDSDDHSAGPEDAPITLVEYGDFECPYCGQAYPIVKSIQKQLGDRIRFVFRNFPITGSHRHAEHAAEASEAAAAQNHYWEMHDTLFENQRALEDRDLLEYADKLALDTNKFRMELDSGVYAADVEEDVSTGIRSGVNGTPTFFVNGERFDGNWADADSFARALSHD
jgi:protein-disulfide isomerase